MVAFPEAELIYANAFHLVKGDFAIEKLQPFLVDVLDQVPANPKKFGNRADRGEPEHIEHRQGERSHIAMASGHKGKSRPPQSRAIPTLQTVEHNFQHALLSSDWTHEKEPSPLPLENRFAAAANRAFNPLAVHLDAEHDPVSDKMGSFVLNTFQSKSVVKYRCGHGLGLLRIVRLASNNTDPAMSIFNFQLSGYAVAGRPKNALWLLTATVRIPATSRSMHEF
jgi:hypothetical protein